MSTETTHDPERAQKYADALIAVYAAHAEASLALTRRVVESGLSPSIQGYAEGMLMELVSAIIAVVDEERATEDQSSDFDPECAWCGGKGWCEDCDASCTHCSDGGDS